MRVLNLVIIIWISICLANPVWAKTKHKRAVHRKTKHSLAVKKTPRPSTAPIYGKDQLGYAINQAINEGNLNAAIAVYVKSMSYGDTLFTRNINQPLTPASTMKVLTAEAALIYLGPEYHFSTQMLTDAKEIKSGVLQGNLYITLSGDPSLDFEDLVELVLTLRTHQIQAIGGNVYIDSTAYDDNFYGPGWEWEDKKYCYGAPIGASIINHNCLSFQVTPSKVTGQTAQIVMSPKYFTPAIKNGVVTAKSKRSRCSLRLSKDPDSVLAIDGCMPAGHYVWGVSYVVEDIPAYNRALFKSLFNQLSIKVNGNVTFGTAPNNLSLISSHESKTLSLLINDMLKKSDNVIAGALFKKIGQVYTRQPGSWETGSYAVSQILAKDAGVNVSGLRILDGSGLSPANLATPQQMMQVLDYAYHHSSNYEFISALPIAGVDGTLKHRMGNIARKVRAKTGTISGVVTLAGYADSGDKEPLAFVIMINGTRGSSWQYRELEDKIATALTRYRREN